MLFWLILMIPAFLVVLWAQSKVSSTYSKYSRMSNSQGITGAEAAQRLLWSNGLGDVRVEMTKGKLTDHYDPRKKALRLSQEVANKSSVAALGIVAHEVGHAVQDNVGYVPLRVRGGLVPVANLGSRLGFLCFIIGLFLWWGGSALGEWLVWTGAGLFAAVVLFSLVTLPVEFNASNRGRQMLQSSGLVTAQESEGVSSMLSAAAMTYVAATLMAIVQLLFFVLMAMGMRR
jgi:hypothetical protein